MASEYDYKKSEYEKGSDSTTAVFTGLFWPVVAALSFGILLAKRRRMKKDDQV